MLKRNWWWALLGWGCLLGTASCDLINPEEPVPAYLYVTPFQFSTDQSSQGSATAKITEAWLTVNGEFLGVYRLPALIPVLTSGAATVKLEAGIKENGISTTPEIYPFYRAFEAQVVLAPNEIDTVRPATRYRDNLRFALLDDFDRGTTAFDALILGNAVSRLRPTTQDALSGQSGLITLSEQSPAVVLGTLNAVRGLLDRGAAVYLEVDYRAEAPAAFGVVPLPAGPNPQLLYAAGFNPSATWNKIYFNLTKVVFDSKAQEFQIILRAELPLKEDGTILRTNARIWLDNIKLVHF